MAKTKKGKNAWTKDNDKLKNILKNLPKCMVLLHNIALDKDLVQLHQLPFPEEKKDTLEHLASCIDTTKNCSNNIWMLKENIQEDSTVDKTFRVTRSRLRKLSKGKNKECKNLKFLNLSFNQYSKVIQPGFVAQEHELDDTTDTSVKSLSIRSNEDSSTSFNTYCNNVRKKTMSTNNKKHNNKRARVQRKLNFESDTSLELVKVSSSVETYLNRKRLTTINYNSKIQETLDEIHPIEVPQTKSDTKYYSVKKYNNNNLCITGVTNGTICDLKLEKCKKIQNIIDNTVQTTGVSKSFNSTKPSLLKSVCPEDCLFNNLSKVNVEIHPDFFITYNEKQHANETNNKKIMKKDLPKITGDHILPKGTIKVMKASASNENLQNNLSKQVSCTNNILESTNIREKYHSSEINGSIEILKLSESTSTFNNNINLKNKNIDNKIHSTKIDHKNGFLKEVKNNIHNNVNANDANNRTTHKEYISDHQERSNELDNDEEHKSNKLQNNKNSETNSDKSILSKNTSNFTDVNENYKIERSLLVSKEEVMKQGRKRIAEENIDIKLDNKKKKLNRIIWQNDITCTKPLNHQSNDFSNIDTIVESNITEKNNFKGEKTDLRERLNKKKSTQPTKLSISKNQFKNSVESKQIDLNNENNIITSTNTIENKTHKRFSFDKELVFSKTLHKEKDIQTDSVCNDHVQCYSTLQSVSEKTQHINQIDKSVHEDTNIQKKCTTNENKDDNNNNDDDDDGNSSGDDCISLFAESFDTNFCESTFFNEQNKSSQFLHSDAPYTMTISSFNKYVEQTETEFNKEYAKCEENGIKTENDIKKLNKTDEIIKEFNNQSRQTVHKDYVPETRTPQVISSEENKRIEMLKYQWLKQNNIGTINNNMKFFHGYCFDVLRKGDCHRSHCRYKTDLQNFIDAVCSENPRMIADIIRDALSFGFNYFCRTIYITLLQKLTIDQILTMYQIFYDTRMSKYDLTFVKLYITQNTITEFLNRQMSLKTIVNSLMKHIAPTNNSNDLRHILTCVENCIKRGEYWNTIRSLILRLPPDKRIIQKILVECIENEKFTDIQDVNNNLINQLSPILITSLDKDIIERFKNLLTEKTENNSCLVAQNFGEKFSQTIASPDGNTNFSQIESPRCSSTFINKNPNENNKTEVNRETYTLQLIDNLPEARSAYRDHGHLWKFYMDLERFKKGLIHNDYAYVINILKIYAEDEDDLFVRCCCNILRKEIERSEKHLTNIIDLTVQMGNFNVLGKMLFDMGLDILNSLMDKEAWGLALRLTQSLDLIDINFPHNAQYFLLLAEIYLANKLPLKAYDLLKYQNIISTGRNKWYVNSTIYDVHTRSKIMHILLDILCNEFIEHAFFLFQFLLRDQYSYYRPIDLSCYVDKFIILSLSKKDTNLITEMANLVLKYTFALSTTTCRALVSTLVHLDENLAKQIYKYAEGIGIYSAVKLWPVTYIIINSDLTEEEIYLIFLQLFQNLLINFGHAIEFAKLQQIKVYLILEIKLTERFYCAELQNYYNNKAITNIKTLIRQVLKNRFDPSILLMKGGKGRMYKLQSKSLINYLKTEHCN